MSLTLHDGVVRQRDVAQQATVGQFARELGQTVVVECERAQRGAVRDVRRRAIKEVARQQQRLELQRPRAPALLVVVLRLRQALQPIVRQVEHAQRRQREQRLGQQFELVVARQQRLERLERAERRRQVVERVLRGGTLSAPHSTTAAPQQQQAAAGRKKQHKKN